LSYEYRNIDYFKVSPDSSYSDKYKKESPIIIEAYTEDTSTMDLIYNINDTNKNIRNMINDNKNLNIEIQNKSKNINNLHNYDIEDTIVKNLEKSNKLKNAIDTINNNNNKIYTYPTDKLIKTIKSKYNSQYISTFSNNINDINNINNINNYGILINDKCLTIKGLCSNEFCLLDCQSKIYKSDSQNFKTERINTPQEAAVMMNVTIDKINSKTIYPFNIFKSLVNDKCLTINNDGVVMERCNLNDIKQHWEISPNENLCVLE